MSALYRVWKSGDNALRGGPIRYFANGRFQLPAIKGEPFLHYGPGSPERSVLETALEKKMTEVIEIPCIINGKEYYTGNKVLVTMPSNHKHTLAVGHLATPAIIKDAIVTSQTAKKEWASMAFEHRAQIFRKAADLMAGPRRASMLASTMLGTGKTVWQAEIDAAVETIDFLRLNTNFAQDIYAVQPPLNSPNIWNRMVYRELEGYVLAISPFNFCAIGANLPTAPAIMGNTVLWKPATTSMLSNYVTYRILLEAGLPPGVISFLPSSGRVIGENAIEHRDFAGLHFTGSTSTFNKLWQQIGGNLANYKSYPRIVGETGGKNFHLVHPSADVEHTVYNTVRAAFEYQGQKCSACSRLYVPRSLWENGMREKLTSTVAQLKVGQPQDFSSFMTAVIDKEAYTGHVAYIKGAKASKECTIIAGGGFDDSEGYFIQPTVIETSNPMYTTMQEEIFGPVLTAYVYDDSKPGYWSSVCRLIDTTSPYALTGSIFSSERTALIEGAEYLRHACGNMYLNDKSTGAVVGEQPFGGGRMSGTNDKAGCHLNLLRWVSAQAIKENSVPLSRWDYPHMQ